MLEKRSHSQLELFAKPSGSSQIKEEGRSLFLSVLWKYEKAILTIIAFIITAVSSFSLGVEKGKKSAILKNNSTLDMAIKKRVTAPSVSTKNAIIRDSSEIKNTAQASLLKNETRQQAPLQTQGYTIQLASYQTITYAQKEADKLKKRGFSPLVLPKGNYQVLCVGRFSDQGAASSLLSELRKQYRDCFIRRL